MPRLADEDDGYLVTFIMNVKSGASKLAVYDAKTMSSEPVATVSVPLLCTSHVQPLAGERLRSRHCLPVDI